MAEKPREVKTNVATANAAPAATAAPAQTALAEANAHEAFESGEYEVWLDVPQDCPLNAVRVACIKKAEATGDRSYSITVERDHQEVPLRCPKCSNQWMPEQPMRPGKVMQLPDERMFLTRYAESFKCKKCAEVSKVAVRGVPRGSEERGVLKTVSVRRRWYLHRNEVAALDAVTRMEDVPEAWVPQYEERTLINGEKRPYAAGFKSRPLVFEWTSHGDPNDKHRINSGKLINFRLIRTAEKNGEPGIDIAQTERTLRSVAEVDRLIQALLTGGDPVSESAEKREAARKRLAELTEKRAQLISPRD